MATSTINQSLYRALRGLNVPEEAAHEAAEVAAGPDLSRLATADALREVRAELKAEVASSARAVEERIGRLERALDERVGRLEKALDERVGRVEDRIGRSVAEAMARQTAWFAGALFAALALGLGAAGFLWPPTRFAPAPTPAATPPPAAASPTPPPAAPAVAPPPPPSTPPR